MIRVLIVDDQVIVCEGLKVVLDASPAIEVVGMAYDGAQALEKVQELQPDLVLMDLKMPVMNGYEATKSIRNIKPDIPVIAVTAFDIQQDFLETYKTHFDGYVVKPIDKEDLLTKIFRVSESP